MWWPDLYFLFETTSLSQVHKREELDFRKDPKAYLKQLFKSLCLEQARVAALDDATKEKLEAFLEAGQCSIHAYIHTYNMNLCIYVYICIKNCAYLEYVRVDKRRPGIVQCGPQKPFSPRRGLVGRRTTVRISDAGV